MQSLIHQALCNLQKSPRSLWKGGGGGKGKAIPLQAWTGPEGSRKVEAPRFQDNRHMKVVRLSALRTNRLYPPGSIHGTHFHYRLSRPQGHSAAGRIMSMKNSNDTIGNRTRDLPTSSVVPQPTALRRTPCIT